MDTFEKYKKLDIDGALISLESGEIKYPYFCYPVNANPIAFEGSILYCYLPEYGEMVFAANPESCSDRYVYPLASDFEAFLRLIIACGSANPIEQIAWMEKGQFVEHLKNELEMQTAEQRELLAGLAGEFALTPMEHPYEYVKALQDKFDDSKIQYSDEYYEVLGIER